MPEATLLAHDSFAVVEVMGHNTFAGQVSEQVIGSTAFFRVYVAPIAEEKRNVWNGELLIPAIPGFEKIISANAIYTITPCTEDIALAVAVRERACPVSVLDLHPITITKADSAQEEEIDIPF